MGNDLRQGPDLMPCGHPQACVQIGEEVADGQYVHYCGWCASLEQLQHQRRLWKYSAKLHREQHLAFQEICHALAERVIDLHSESRKLREALEASEHALAEIGRLATVNEGDVITMLPYHARKLSALLNESRATAQAALARARSDTP